MTSLEARIRDDLKVLTISDDLRQFLVGYCMGLVDSMTESTIRTIKEDLQKEKIEAMPDLEGHVSTADLDMMDQTGKRLG